MDGVSQLPAPSQGLGAFHPCRGLRPWTAGRDAKETLSLHPPSLPIPPEHDDVLNRTIAA